MNKSPRYRSLLRTVLSGILSSKLSTTELRSLSEELRRGQFPDELAYIIDQINSHLAADDDERADEDTVLAAERLIKRRKIPRSALANILQSLGAEESPASVGIRRLLQAFVSDAPPARIRKLMEVLESSSEGDAFLAGIAGSRG